jgi:hypothetical protein
MSMGSIGRTTCGMMQLDREEISEANALLGTNVGATQRELFSFVTDMGWAVTMSFSQMTFPPRLSRATPVAESSTTSTNMSRCMDQC